MGQGTRARSQISGATTLSAALLALGGPGCGASGTTGIGTGGGPGSSSATGGGGGSATTPTTTTTTTAITTTATAGGAAASRCAVTSTMATCDHQMAMLSDSTAMRSVTYETPIGQAPASGWPAVVYFQGSLVPGHTSFSATTADPYGMYELTLTIKALLDGGYAVLAPDAASSGSLFWDTNIPPYAAAWSGCPDDVLMKNLFAGISGGTFGPLDSGKLYAMGISSGGFMTSRMAVSYPGRFRALADHSGSYATCSDVCVVPTPLPSGHPPTLFLHGDLDAVVPMSAVQPYIDALNAGGFVSSLITDPTAGHQWLATGPQAIPAWFAAHP